MTGRKTYLLIEHDVEGASEHVFESLAEVEAWFRDRMNGYFRYADFSDIDLYECVDSEDVVELMAKLQAEVDAKLEEQRKFRESPEGIRAEEERRANLGPWARMMEDMHNEAVRRMFSDEPQVPYLDWMTARLYPDCSPPEGEGGK